VKKIDDMFIRFDTTHERVRRTDEQTDRHRMTAKSALDASIARIKRTKNKSRAYMWADELTLAT